MRTRRGAAPRSRRPWPGVAVLLRRHRRLLVAVALATASGVAVDAATAAPPPGVAVVVAARDLPAGHALDDTDMAAVSVPTAAVADGVLGRDQLVGDVLAAPVRRGEVLTDVRVLRAVAAGLADGQVAVPVRLDDDGSLRWLQPGRRVSVLAVSADPVSGGASPERATADVVARDVVVLDVPAPGSGSMFGVPDASAPVVLLSVTEPQARSLAARSATGWLTVTLLP